MELSIRDVITILLKRLGIIILCCISFGLGAFLISKYIIDPTYQSTLSLYVFNDDRNNKDQALNTNDLLTAQKLVNTYMAVLNTDNFLNTVIDDLKLNYQTDKLRSSIKMSAIKDTELFKITVETTDPALSMHIAKSIGKLAPNALKTIVQTGRTEIVDVPVMATRQSSPNILFSTIIGLLLGLGGSSMIVILMDLLDTKVKNIDDILSKYDIPVLGSAPKRELGGTTNVSKK